MLRGLGVVAGLIGIVLLSGCGSGTPKEEVIHIKPAGDPVAPACAVLQRYADGQPLASEVTSFPGLVEDLRKADPAKAEILEKGLADIQKLSPGACAAKARELLTKLPAAAK